MEVRVLFGALAIPLLTGSSGPEQGAERAGRVETLWWRSGPRNRSAVAWGAASGVASAAAFALLYRTLAIRPMSVLSPVTALVSAALPVSVGLVAGALDSLANLAFLVVSAPRERG